jgi:hypothetical protein
VNQHGGYITLDSRPGDGSTFKVCFPLLDAKAEEQAPSKSDQLPRGNGERILLVDDDPAIANLHKLNLLEKTSWRSPSEVLCPNPHHQPVTPGGKSEWWDSRFVVEFQRRSVRRASDVVRIAGAQEPEDPTRQQAG